MSVVNQLSQPQVATPRSLTVTGATPALLQTAIDAQTNVLNKTMRIPAVQTVNNNGSFSNYPSGNVATGSIKVSDTRAWVSTSNAVTYYAAVSWTEYVTPS